MAISEAHFNLLCDLRRRNVLPENPCLLEIGQATYYGDMDKKRIVEACKEFRPEYVERMQKDISEDRGPRHLASLIYLSMFNEKCEWRSIDPGGDEWAIKEDLNEPLDLGELFNLVYNHGTAEHVFNIANVFKVMHDHCEVGGVMIHEAPFTGWVNHGFWNLQPTAFYDVARANNYRIEGLWIMHLPSVQTWRFDSQEHLLREMQSGKLPNNLNLFVAFRKIWDRPFGVPQQGIYTDFSSNEVREAWSSMR